MRLTQETWLSYFCLFGSPSFSFSVTKLPGFRDWLSDAFPRLTGLAGALCGAPDFPSGSDDASRLQLYSLLFCLQRFALTTFLGMALISQHCGRRCTRQTFCPVILGCAVTHRPTVHMSYHIKISGPDRGTKRIINHGCKKAVKKLWKSAHLPSFGNETSDVPGRADALSCCPVSFSSFSPQGHIYGVCKCFPYCTSSCPNPC